ncbi:MAG: hypothetical protein LBQ81_12745 [Zoogloeaceae bacterium]|jgi:hypothetical protein|nr:hypothetical protein [Zoogloeaceae bacterium]
MFLDDMSPGTVEFVEILLSSEAVNRYLIAFAATRIWGAGRPLREKKDMLSECITILESLRAAAGREIQYCRNTRGETAIQYAHGAYMVRCMVHYFLHACGAPYDDPRVLECEAQCDDPRVLEWGARMRQAYLPGLPPELVLSPAAMPLLAVALPEEPILRELKTRRAVLGYLRKRLKAVRSALDHLPESSPDRAPVLH